MLTAPRGLVLPAAVVLVLALALSIAVGACRKRNTSDDRDVGVEGAIASLAAPAVRQDGARLPSRLVAALPFEIGVTPHFARDGARALYEHNANGKREVRVVGGGAWQYAWVQEVRVSDTGGAFAILATSPDRTEGLLRRETGSRNVGRWPVTIHFIPGTSRLFVADGERACVEEHCESLRCDGVPRHGRNEVRSRDGRLLVLSMGSASRNACMFVVTFAGEDFSMRRVEGAYGPKLVAGAADLTYIHLTKRGAYVVHGDTRWGPHDDPPGVVDLSPSGAHVGYAIRGSSTWAVYVDGSRVAEEPVTAPVVVCTPSIPPSCSEGPGSAPFFAFEGEVYTKGAARAIRRRLLATHGDRGATIFRDREMVVRVGTTEWTGFEAVDAQSLSFSEDGRRVRFGAVTRPNRSRLELRWYDVALP